MVNGIPKVLEMLVTLSYLVNKIQVNYIIDKHARCFYDLNGINNLKIPYMFNILQKNRERGRKNG